MIKTGIIGSSSEKAGELIRILVNHPEVDLITLYEPMRKGESVNQCHPGLVGETSLVFTDRLDTSALDLVYIAADDAAVPSVLSLPVESGPMVVDMRPHPEGMEGDIPAGMTYGLSEINRKPLVRGARRAVIPSPEAAVLLVAIYPLAAHLVLNAPLQVEFSGTLSGVSPEGIAREVSSRICEMQQSYCGKTSIRLVPDPAERRGLRVRFRITTPISLQDIQRMYDEIYDDHNFSFILSEKRSSRDVSGTQKCLITLTKTSPSELEVEAIADGKMRGMAGDAVHVMNLLFGLQEKTGLALKATYL